MFYFESKYTRISNQFGEKNVSQLFGFLVCEIIHIYLKLVLKIIQIILLFARIDLTSVLNFSTT